MNNDPLYDAVFMAVFNAELLHLSAKIPTADEYELVVKLAHAVATLAVKGRQ
jgi:hypothetical protein